MKTKTRKTPTPDARSAYEAVRIAAETIRNDEPATIPPMEPGDCVRQGDVYIVAVDVAPAGKPYGSRQLAPGTTLGSRHIVEGDCDVLAVDKVEATRLLNRLVPATEGLEQFVGPMIIAKGPITITHPEHGWRSLPPGTYLVVGQRTWAEEVRRTAD